MDTLVYITITVIISVTVTSLMVKRHMRNQLKQQIINTHTCPFSSACLEYNQDHTTEAALRVIRLILEKTPPTPLHTTLQKAIREISELTNK